MTRRETQARKAIEEAQGLLEAALDPAVPENVRLNLQKLLETRLAEALAFLTRD